LIALTLGDGEALGREMVARLAACGVSAVARELTVDQRGRTIRPLSSSALADNPTDETLCHP
jgi:hypothetical protein